MAFNYISKLQELSHNTFNEEEAKNLLLSTLDELNNLEDWNHRVIQYAKETRPELIMKMDQAIEDIDTAFYTKDLVFLRSSITRLSAAAKTIHKHYQECIFELNIDLTHDLDTISSKIKLQEIQGWSLSRILILTKSLRAIAVFKKNPTKNIPFFYQNGGA